MTNWEDTSDAEITAWLQVAMGEATQPDLVAKGDTPGHAFHGNQWTSGGGNWGDKNNTPEALSSVKASDYASNWNQVPMTDTAAKIMEAEDRHPDMAEAIKGTPKMSNDERSADAIPNWLVNQATPADMNALTDNNFHSSVRYIESQRPDLAQ